MLKDYLRSVFEFMNRGDAREESYYSTLENLLSHYAKTTERRNIHITTLPKSTEAGNPDFRIWDGKQKIVGYVEAKAPSVDRLDLIEDSEQLVRYRTTFPNLILTNFHEFRFYRDGKLVDSTFISRPYQVKHLREVLIVENEQPFLNLLDKFFSFSLPKVQNAKSLALELAKRTRFLKDEVIAQELLESEEKEKGFIYGFYEAFKHFLITDLTPDDFADLYSQTITYGLFAARTRSENGFNRKLAYDNIPQTIGILRDVFEFVSRGKLPRQMEWIIDDISEVLAVTDVNNILHQYYHEGKGKDPIIHFYETFLAEYDPQTRERRGVYYTPEPVVSYIVRSLHTILKTEFGKPDGLASEGVTLLDPAAGTMTFIARAAQEAVLEFESKYGAGARGEFIRRHILRNFYAFELMMAPYAVGHLKMSFFLEELGHRLADDERVPFYLTNTLDMEELAQTRIPGIASLAEESHLAGEIKKQTPLLVILGNPPYSGHSVNRGAWILGKIDDYKRVDGKPLGEKNPKWLQDDYVKFLRFAQWKIEQAGRGVVGMITNHSYLDNPTFRGMRQSLMGTFDNIYILDLHGNSLKKETCPDGGRDENVFDIRQGVAIAFFIKRGGKKKSGDVTIRHTELWGTQEPKYTWLTKHDITATPWQDLQPRSPFYLFVPRDEALTASYNTFIHVTELFPINSVGIVTARDNLTIHWSPEETWRTVTVFSRMEPEFARQGYKLGKDTRDWKVILAQKDLLDSGPTRNKIVPILYRPFDMRYTYYTGKSRGFICMPRPEVMRHILAGENLHITFTRSISSGKPFSHVICANIGVLGRFFPDAACITYFAPIFLYPNNDHHDLFAHHEISARRPNLNPKVVATLATAYGREPTPEEIFHYVYAVLYAPAYREKYTEFLRMDFPRIPFTADREIFRAMVVLGERLTALHLLKSPELDPPAARFDGEGDCRVSKSKSQGFRYDAGSERVSINQTQYFAPVPPVVWEYQVGGYQVCEKWLKDRRGRKLDMDDIRRYCRVATALKKTIEIQNQIDRLYQEVEKEVIHFS